MDLVGPARHVLFCVLPYSLVYRGSIITVPSKILDYFRHAFAVNDASSHPDAVELAAADAVCQAIFRRGMTLPAMVFLESMRPLNYVSSQTMHFFSPFATAVMDASAYEAFARFLERRDSVDWLCRRLEELEKCGGTPISGEPETPPPAETPAERKAH